MEWLLLSLVSSVLLGGYDILKKISLNNNAVLPVLFLASTFGAIPFMLMLAGSKVFPDFFMEINLYVPEISLLEHALFFLKSIIVGTSWILAYFALKNLPVTIVAPIRSTGPIWTLAGAILIFGERLAPWQWIGFIVTFIFFYLFSVTGKKEGIVFHKNKWIYFIVLATLVGSISGLYDKFLIINHNRLAVQAWFSLYMIVFLSPWLLFFWYPKRGTFKFHWKWTIPCIGLVLSSADFAYFYALSFPGALISLISAIRRGSVIVSFGLGAILFREKNIGVKAFILAGILLGLMIIIFGS